MTLRLPPDLYDDLKAVTLLRSYFGLHPGEPDFYTGSLFDTWDSLGTREQDRDCFTADDLAAVTFLSVQVPPEAAYRLLVTHKDLFRQMLAAIGPDRDLAGDAEPLALDGPEWAQDGALKDLPGVGATIASKLLARKRLRLRPIYYSVVAARLGTQRIHWEPIRAALRDDDGALQGRLVALHTSVGLHQAVSPLRVLDVLVGPQGR